MFLFCFENIEKTFGRNNYEVFAECKKQAEEKLKNAGITQSLTLRFVTENYSPDCPLKMIQEEESDGKEV